MINMISTAVKLSERLSDFGQSAESIAIIEQAISENEWFTASDICNSVNAICSEMLKSDKLTKWLSLYPTLKNCKSKEIAIIMAGNIPLVGFFDLLCTLFARHKAWIKTSSKDRVLMQYICDLIKDINPLIPIYIYEESRKYDAIIATGGVEANIYFESKFKEVKRLCRSNRHSIAVLSENTTSEQIQELSNDIYTYSGLGCRNVAMIFVPKGSDIVIPPHSKTNNKYINNYKQTKALLTLKGTSFNDNGTSIIIKSKTLPQSLSTISLWEYNSIKEVELWIKEHDHKIQCIVSDIINHPRRVNFGEAQHPTLTDYADGIDTMNFLEFKD